MDDGMTNRFEVSLFPNSTEAEGEGILIHSKEATGEFIKDWPTLVQLIKNELE